MFPSITKWKAFMVVTNFFFLNSHFPLYCLNERALYGDKASILTNVPSLLAW